MQLYETLSQSTIEIPNGATFSIKKIGKTRGYDGHSLRAFTYYPEHMPDIINTVESINSIEGRYKSFRQRSKTPTFRTYLSGYVCNINE